MEGTLAEIKIFAGNFAPKNWAFCHGQLLTIDLYGNLFSVIGTTYGGDGRSTFGVPDLRNRGIVGASTNTLGSHNSALEVKDEGQLMIAKELALNYIICIEGSYPSAD